VLNIDCVLNANYLLNVVSIMKIDCRVNSEN